MEKTYLNYMLIAAFLFFIFSVVLYMFSEGIIKNNSADNLNNPQDNLKSPEDNFSKDSSPVNDNSQISNSNPDSASNNQKELPLDINSSNCGFYYSEYGVCAGTCPEGKCISEKRSCYCKKV